MDTGSTELVSIPISKAIQAHKVAGVQRLAREKKQTVNYKPSMQGKTYLLATAVLGESLLGDDNYHHDPMVAFAFMQQPSLKAALKQCGSEAELAGIKEASQILWRDTFVPKKYSTLTEVLNTNKQKCLRVTCLL